MKTVFLQGADSLRRMFRPQALSRLQVLGEVVTRDAEGNASPEEIRGLLKGASVAVTSWGCERLDGDLIKQAGNLELVVHAGGSVKPIVSPELFARGVRVAANARALGVGVAETTLGLTIASLKNLWQLAADTAKGGWDEHYDRIREVYAVTIGVVGAGYAGRHYMKLLQSFDVDILLYDPFVSAQEAAEMGARKVELEELLSLSDVVSIHAPSIPQTHHMFCKRTFGLMKDDAILINTARGSLLDEAALYEEMAAGRFRYACIDVTDPEPPAADHPLRALPNVIMTPHLAGLTNNGLMRIGDSVVKQIEAYARGEAIDGEVTADMLFRIA